MLWGLIFLLKMRIKIFESNTFWIFSMFREVPTSAVVVNGAGSLRQFPGGVEHDAIKILNFGLIQCK